MVDLWQVLNEKDNDCDWLIYDNHGSNNRFTAYIGYITYIVFTWLLISLAFIVLIFFIY